MLNTPTNRILFLLLFFLSSLAQTSYWVYFTDKASTPLSIDFSPEKLQRHHRKSIPLDWHDLPVNPHYLRTLKQDHFRIKWCSRWFNAAIVEVTSEDQLHVLYSYPFVRRIRPVQCVIPLPASMDQNQNLDYGSSLLFIEQVRLDSLHRRGFMGQNVKIGVFDAGFTGVDTMKGFDSLRLNRRLISYYDYYEQDSSVFEDSNHGTSVLSIMAGYLPQKYIGGAPLAHYFLARTEVVAFERHIEEYLWAQAAETADSLGIDIINTSLGYNIFDPGEGDYSYADMDGNTTIITQAADLAASRGILVVSSAGNEGYNRITAPCDGDSVLCVGATDINNRWVPFSSVGPSADGRVKPDVAALGASTPILVPYLASPTSGSGTSFSAPIVTSLAACLQSAFPQASPQALYQAIIQSASQFNAPDSLLGYGIPNGLEALLLLSLSQNPLPSSPMPTLKVLYGTDGKLSFVLFHPSILPLSYEILSPLGNTILKQEHSGYTNFRVALPTDLLAQGCYILRVFTEQEQFTQPFYRF